MDIQEQAQNEAFKILISMPMILRKQHFVLNLEAAVNAEKLRENALHKRQSYTFRQYFSSRNGKLKIIADFIRDVGGMR